MTKKQEFKAHASHNWCDMEIQVDEAGKTLRVREGEEVGRWQKIYFNRGGSTYFLREGRRWRLDEFKPPQAPKTTPQQANK